METINNGMTLKIMVEADQIDNIFSAVDDEITFVHRGWKFIGILLRVASKRRKNDDGEYCIWKELSILVENVTIDDKTYLFVDKKEFFLGEVELGVS